MAVNNVKSAIGSVPPEAVPGEVFQADARLSPDFEGPIVVCTDPPYFANVGFSDLSDFYYVWLRRTLGRILPEFFSTVLVPKDAELVANPHRFGDDGALAEANFLHGMTAAFQRLRQIDGDEYPLTAYYEFKESMGPENEERDESSEESGSPAWEKMLGALIMAGRLCLGTLAVRTGERQRKRGH